jgi:hypothetical protein
MLLLYLHKQYLKKSIFVPQKKIHPHFEDQTDNAVSDGQTFVLRSTHDVKKHIFSLEKARSILQASNIYCSYSVLAV